MAVVSGVDFVNEKGVHFVKSFVNRLENSFRFLPYYYVGYFCYDGHKFFLGSESEDKADSIIEALTGMYAVTPQEIKRPSRQGLVDQFICHVGAARSHMSVLIDKALITQNVVQLWRISLIN